jgi:DNA-binding NarL/FixJ family response regulator
MTSSHHDSEHPIRILLADDHAILREGVALMLNAEPDMIVVAQAATGRKAVDLFREHRPHIGIMDMDMPDGDGAETIASIRTFEPDARLIVLTTFIGSEDVFRAISAGAKGYLLKGEDPDEFLACIRKVAAEGRYVPPVVAEQFSDRLPEDALTDREMAVLKCLVEGKSNTETATELHVTESTVKFHLGLRPFLRQS